MKNQDNKKNKYLTPTRPSAALRTAYQKKLLRLVDKMSASVEWWLGAEYKKLYPKFAADGAAQDLAEELSRVMGKWQKEFNVMGKDMAKWFAKSSAGYTSQSIKEALKEAGYTVAFKNTRKVQDMIRSIVIENAGLIKSISSEYRTEVEGLIQRSVQAGRDIGFLREELEKRYGITKRRAILRKPSTHVWVYFCTFQ